MLTRQGKKYAMSVALGDVAPTATWYLGIINFLGGLGENTPIVEWTMANKVALFDEFSDFTNPTRLVWTPQAFVDGRVLGTTLVPYLTTNGLEPWGMFLTNNSNPITTTGIILSVHQISVPVHYDAGIPISGTLWVSNK